MKNKEEKLDEYDEKMDDLFLIHSTTYVILTDQILSLMPSQRNVMLTMNEYCLNDINPVHPNNEESPTHVIIFCVRFIADDTFQPIGGLLIYKQEDQSVLLAECLKAYINDLWKLGLYVVATVSPPFETFKGIINNLVDTQNACGIFTSLQQA
ncbi:hypothetical protein NQ318_015245 [Aromia moschata]|uniref:Uncharacterized protein n=1 Tax=Aromia moschata TaxID=1265417 RepID=A0AAV8YHP2_9CUCU|nr:hypothetical protein NQ318_015245 [Aromia moschata]